MSINGKRNMEKGMQAAFSMGAEYTANPGSSRRDYLNDSAFYFREGVETFRELTEEEKKICTERFEAGCKRERELQKE